jgi:hypothetical protein
VLTLIGCVPIGATASWIDSGAALSPPRLKSENEVAPIRHRDIFSDDFQCHGVSQIDVEGL